MNGWGWVVLGYGAVGVLLTAYVASISLRMRTVLRRLHELD